MLQAPAFTGLPRALPLTGTGLLPVLYAVIVVPLAFWLLGRWQRKAATR